jgi:hypothetical protein
MMRGYVQDIPRSLEEAALVDGCTHWEVFWKVVNPHVQRGPVCNRYPSHSFLRGTKFLFALVLTRTEVTTYTVQVTHDFGGQSEFPDQDSRHVGVGNIARLHCGGVHAALFGTRYFSLAQSKDQHVADLQIETLHKYYGDNHVVKGIDLSIPAGQFTVPVGQSGCGKSTLRCEPLQVWNTPTPAALPLPVNG